MEQEQSSHITEQTNDITIEVSIGQSAPLQKRTWKLEGWTSPSMEGRLRQSKWVSTVASTWIQCTSGSLYTFSVYSQTLKTTQGYDQSTLDTVSVFKDFGANCGILSGILYSYSAKWYGPWLVLLAGAVQCFLGYFLMWAAVVRLIPRPPVPVMCLFMFLASHAQSFFNTSNVVTGVRNFPHYKGTIVGIMKV